ncbi:hypothetical protein TgHK011_004444 [Trichoderma gracile]|nr:hypothetical protein TgHK011_004444 [Trichoderma gracile]
MVQSREHGSQARKQESNLEAATRDTLSASAEAVESQHGGGICASNLVCWLDHWSVRACQPFASRRRGERGGAPSGAALAQSGRARPQVEEEASGDEPANSVAVAHLRRAFSRFPCAASTSSPPSSQVPSYPLHAEDAAVAQRVCAAVLQRTLPYFCAEGALALEVLAAGVVLGSNLLLEDTKEEETKTRIAVHCCLCYSFDRSLAGSWSFPVTSCSGAVLRNRQLAATCPVSRHRSAKESHSRPDAAVSTPCQASSSLFLSRHATRLSPPVAALLQPPSLQATLRRVTSHSSP